MAESSGNYDNFDLVIIGAGLSGLAAGLRAARFGLKVIILEKHVIPGGLNSYYTRKNILFETGLHAITNYAEPKDRKAPLNRLLRQLKISRDELKTHEQLESQIHFSGLETLNFNNDFSLLTEEVARAFPEDKDNFVALSTLIDTFDAFSPKPRQSAREELKKHLKSELLIEMLLCPLFYYGSAEENDIDFSQFVIMFRAIFKEGFFRCEGGIKWLLDLIVERYKSMGGEIRFRANVEKFHIENDEIKHVELKFGDQYKGRFFLSTIGYPNTLSLMGRPETEVKKLEGNLSFVEAIYLLDPKKRESITHDKTIIFYNNSNHFHYERPTTDVDVRSAVICFPDNFQNIHIEDNFQLRITHLANYDHWKSFDKKTYKEKKTYWNEQSQDQIGKVVGPFYQDVIFEDSFTPMTIEKFTWKGQGAIYGSPVKIKDGDIGLKNGFLAGTDQGFLGIVGSMLSGVSIVNQHILAK